MINHILSMILNLRNRNDNHRAEIEKRLAAVEEQVTRLAEVNEVLSNSLAKTSVALLEMSETNHYLVEQIDQIHDVFISAGIISPTSKLGYIMRLPHWQIKDDDSL